MQLTVARAEGREGGREGGRERGREGEREGGGRRVEGTKKEMRDDKRKERKRG